MQLKILRDRIGYREAVRPTSYKRVDCSSYSIYNFLHGLHIGTSMKIPIPEEYFLRQPCNVKTYFATSRYVLSGHNMSATRSSYSSSAYCNLKFRIFPVFSITCVNKRFIIRKVSRKDLLLLSIGEQMLPYYFEL